MNDVQKKQWQAFIHRNALVPMELSAVIVELRKFLLPVLESSSLGNEVGLAWRAVDGWR
jgi:hypothetical protein